MVFSASLVSIIVVSCWPGIDEDRLGVCDSPLRSVLDGYLLGFLGSLMLYATQSASRMCQGCPGSTGTSPMWLRRCNTLSLSLSPAFPGPRTCQQQPAYHRLALPLPHACRGLQWCSQRGSWNRFACAAMRLQGLALHHQYATSSRLSPGGVGTSALDR